MKIPHRIRFCHSFLTGLSSLGILLTCTGIGTAQDLQVKLINGQTLRGTSLGNANEDHVELINERDRIRISRQLLWTQIESVRIDDQVYTSQEICHRLLREPGAESISHSPSHRVPHSAFSPWRPAMAQISQPPFPLIPIPAPPSPSFSICDPPYHLPALMPATAAPLPIPIGRVIGIREDPLNAYPCLRSQFFPAGIPPSEAPFALALFRSALIQSSEHSPFLPPLNATLPSPRPQIWIEAFPLTASHSSPGEQLAVRLGATSPTGEILPIYGTVTLTLFGQPVKFSNLQSSSPDGVVTLATWTRQIPSQETMISPELIWSDQLPLPASATGGNLKLSAWGEVHAKLIVPGEGVFQASCPVQLRRPLTPIRQELLRTHGSTLLPTEIPASSPQPHGQYQQNELHLLVE